MILAFASLTEMFAQKADNEANTNDDSDTAQLLLSPIINSKYQETVFQKVFNASAEDIGNTSFDAAICHSNTDGTQIKYLIGIKTFGIGSGFQKVAQFKANHNEWSELINEIRLNSYDDNGELRTKTEIDAINHDLYLQLARNIATLRNMRIESSKSNIQGFSVSMDNDNIEAIYHVLMPSKKGDSPLIYVGETSYDNIDSNNIIIEGCTSPKNPTNFMFSDGNHEYRYTSADSQLLMNFNNRNIVKEQWTVRYADNAYDIFSEFADKIYGSDETIAESYSWLITNDEDEVELFSGFNSFFGLGSKLTKKERPKYLSKLNEKFSGQIDADKLHTALQLLNDYLNDNASTKEAKRNKIKNRERITDFISSIGNEAFKTEALKIIYRPQNELYIPIPNSRKFHSQHPDFFGTGIGNLKKNANGKWELPLPKEQNSFTLVFEPSGDKLEAFITQDSGKAIESCNHQSYLGEWILRGVFQLKEYEPLTAKKLKEIGINGIRLYKLHQSSEIHLQFIWIDKNNLPEDYIL